MNENIQENLTELKYDEPSCNLYNEMKALDESKFGDLDNVKILENLLLQYNMQIPRATNCKERSFMRMKRDTIKQQLEDALECRTNCKIDDSWTSVVDNETKIN